MKRKDGLKLRLLYVFGLFLTFAASPGVAERNHIDPYHFIKRQLVFIGPAIAVMIATAFLSFTGVRRVSALVLLGALCGMVYVLLFGVEIKGATRWINVLGVGLQPSEFMKPAFAVVCAWLLASGRLIRQFPGYIASFVLFFIVAGLLFL